jgi:hypothetical protein
MANIRVLASLEKTASDMRKIKEQVVAKDAIKVRDACDEIEKIAKELGRIAYKTYETDYRKNWNG